MHVTPSVSELSAVPGETVTVSLDVVNTTGVIDGIVAGVLGFPDEAVHASPALLPVFPESRGQVVLNLTIPTSYPAGRHPVTVELRSQGAGLPSTYVDLIVEVAAAPAFKVLSRPRIVRTKRGGRFVVEVVNQGNVPLDVELSAVDPERKVRTGLTPKTLRAPAGMTTPVLLTLRGPRMIFGGEVDRPVEVEAQARVIDPIDPESGAAEDLTDKTTVRLRQRARIPRGMLTCLVLLAIVGLWAGAFLFGLFKVFTGDPFTKAAPASFFASSLSAANDQRNAHSIVAAVVVNGAPAGSLPKNGQVPAGVGGTISGTVIARTTDKGIGRILVEAQRQTPTGLVTVSSSATQSDGTYTLAGLFPTSYLVKFSAAGYTTVYYPSAPGPENGKFVTVDAQKDTPGIDAVVIGGVASVSGKVDAGETLSPVITSVTARMLDAATTDAAGNAVPALVPVTGKTAADGSYKISGLPAPGTYELTFTAPGYQATTVVDAIAGGQQRMEPTVRLSVGSGSISGTVTSSGTPLGGVTVTTTADGNPVTLTTPTSGAIGLFVLGNLPTPATYVITFSRDGYGSQTTVVDLAAAQNRAGLSVDLAAGTGSVTGTVTAANNGAALGGATVTVGGFTGPGGTVPTTTTLTKGLVGTFAINGLTAPGSYTLTVSLPGYQSASVPVSLTGAAPSTVQVALQSDLGNIVGTVTCADSKICQGYAGATITATDGQHIFTTTSVSASRTGQLDGSYELAGLPPGVYSVTASAKGFGQQTRLVTVVATQTVFNADLALPPASGGSS